MADYKKIAEEALRKANLAKQNKGKTLNESVVYPEGLCERMDPILELELAEGKHSLERNPILPSGDESSFEQKGTGQKGP